MGSIDCCGSFYTDSNKTVIETSKGEREEGIIQTTQTSAEGYGYFLEQHNIVKKI